jgi:dTDP-4-dehydrorhamnose 3,5-epimerase
MRFSETGLKGALLVEPELRGDERGFFARAFCRQEFQAHGLNPDLAQCNLSFNRLAGTLRGMHYQRSPHAEAKLVRCTAGTVYDVIVDLRPDSSTFMKWEAAELSAENRRLLYVPEGFAHGYQALTDGAEVFYQVSAFYHPPSEGGLRWDDPAFGIEWPLPVSAISAKDASYPDWRPER